ncbi:DNA polymerase III subunit delta' [Halalkalibacterium halodurans]|uniref:DNA polymerase III subunit delta' n=1 Tax=Halalkalibacterium halodurans TaxID=86665 RepID=UPI00106743C5|nr:DNA polymerase III subunit delta' [Halalkalibacterium halodurans]TES55505.1 DNA polymerase III subunit delta' [Halalkalibacterium halodurans]
MTWENLAKNQPFVATMLKNSLAKGRLAHAYIFDGNRGTGKKRMALHLAKSFFCAQRAGVEPCQTCKECKRIEHGNHPDVHFIEPDGQSIKKHQVEHLQKEFSYRGMESAKKVYIVNHADKMTTSAANSLLKFLEEPLADTVAILLTEQLQNMLPTIKSRSQVLSFAPLEVQAFAKLLEEGGISESVSNLLASLTTSFEEAMAFVADEWIAQARSLVLQLMEELQSRPNQVLLTVQDQWLPHFDDRPKQELGLELLLLWFRDLLYTQVGKEEAFTYVGEEEALSRQALALSQHKVRKGMTAIIEAKRHLSANVSPQLVMEKLMLRLQEG